MASLWERVRSLFGRRFEKKKIEQLLERRARLTARRELIYSEVQRLERREKELLEQGREAESKAQKRRLAAQLAGLRKDLERRNTAANVLNRNIDILSTHVHNLELIVGDHEALRPDAQELNDAALKVDDILARIKEDSDLVAGIEADRSAELMSNEEAEILQEFERGREAELEHNELRPEDFERLARIDPEKTAGKAAEKPRVEKAVDKSAEKTERVETERAEKSERAEKAEKSEKVEKSERPPRTAEPVAEASKREALTE